MTGLTLINIHKSFPAPAGQPGRAATNVALAGVSFQVPVGQITAVVGPSGCGKSTLLSIIAGLETPDHGDVLWDGRSIQHVPPYQRNFGLMFQDFALFPHKNVYQNIEFGLCMQSCPAREMRQRVQQVLELVGLPGFERRDINRLSGGEQQRVALARALAPRPRLLMLDEPLGSLDRLLRERLVEDLRRILKTSQQTAIYVTHDQEEAFVLADQVVVMNAGQVEQVGPPDQVYYRPASLFVAQFLGMSNLLTGVLLADRAGQDWKLETALGSWQLPANLPDLEPGSVTVLIRPEAAEPGGAPAIQLEGRLRQRSFRGRAQRIVFEINGIQLTFDVACSANLPPEGELYTIQLDPTRDILIYPPSSLADHT